MHKVSGPFASVLARQYQYSLSFLNTKGSTYFSSFILLISEPPITARMMPTKTYAIAIRQLKMLASNSTDARSTKGDEIKNEKVTPIGSPALVKPIKSGIDEHEQNGVIVPKSAPIVLAPMPLYLPKILRVRSGGKWLWI